MNECFDKKTLYEYLDGGLDENTRDCIKNHIDECPNCKGILKSLKHLEATLLDWGHELRRSQLKEHPHLTVEQLLGYLEDTLSGDEKIVVQQHLNECVACAQELSITRLEVSLFEEGKLPSPPKGFAQRMVNELINEGAKRGIISPQAGLKKKVNEVTARYHELLSGTISNIAEPIRQHAQRRYAAVRVLETLRQHVQKLVKILSEILPEYQLVPHFPQAALVVNPAHSEISSDSKPRFHIIWNAPKRGDLELFIAQTKEPVVMLGKPTEFDAISSSLPPHQSYSVMLSEKEQEDVHELALQCYNEILSKQSESMQDTIDLILMLARFDLSTPFAWLPEGEVLRQEAQNESFPFLEPINPKDASTPSWEDATHITAVSDLLAVDMLKAAGRFSNDALNKQCRSLFDRIFSNEELAQENIDLIYLLLHSLALNRQRVADILMREYNEKLKELQDLSDVRYIHSWAKIYKEVGMWREAKELLEKAREKEPENVYILTTLGDTYAKLRDYDKAIEKLEMAKSQTPSTPYPLQIEGRIYKEMPSQFGLGVEKFELAAEKFEKALSIDPKNVYVLHAWGEMALERGHLKPKISEYDNMRIWSAERKFNEVLQRDSENIPTLVSLGKMYTELKEYDKSQEHLEMALEIEPENLHAIVTYSDLKIEQGKWQEAKNLLERARSVYGDEPVIITTLAKLLIRQDNYEDAKKLLKKATESGNREAEIVAFNILVQLYCKQQKYEEASKFYSEADKRNPNNVQTHNTWVNSLIEADKEIISNFKKTDLDPFEICKDALEEIDPLNTYTLRTCGLLEKRFGDKEKAQKLLKRAWKLGLCTKEVKETLEEI